MKKIIIMYVVLSCQLDAQLLNGSFEDTTITVNPFMPAKMDTMPRHWHIDRPFGAAMVNDAFEGNNAVMLWSWYFGQSNGEMWYGRGFNAALPIAGRPDKLKGRYKYLYANSSNGVQDSGTVKVYMMRYNAAISFRDTIGKGELHLGQQVGYTPFEVKIRYTSSVMPDSISVYFGSSLYQFTNCNEDGNGNCNYLFIDDLLTGVNTGVDEYNTNSTSVYPNPAGSYIKVKGLDGEAMVKLFNLTGQCIFKTIAPSQGLIDLSWCAKGIYILRIEQGNKVETVKVIRN